MRRPLSPLLIAACLILSQALQAVEIRQLTWNDLIPADLRSENLMKGLDQDQREMVVWVINMLEILPERGPDNKTDYEEIDKAMPSLRKAGINITDLLNKRQKIRTSVVAELDGQQVRISGYLLPLEVIEDRVHEFLLVPYVGACIHVPPPPLNQIVHVKVVGKEGYKSQGLFEPVWATGKMSVKKTEKELYLVDGSAGVDIGYAMHATRIEPYK